MIDYKLFRKLVTELKLYGLNVSQSIEFLKMIVQKYPADLQSYKSVRMSRYDDWNTSRKHITTQMLSSVPLEPKSFKKES